MPVVIATLNFNLPEESAQHERAVFCDDAWGALHDVDQHCRSVVKHGHQYKSVEEFAAEIRRMISARTELR